MKHMTITIPTTRPTGVPGNLCANFTEPYPKTIATPTMIGKRLPLFLCHLPSPMDVRLPDMRGTEAARILRREKETSGIPIVFVTASVMAGGIEEIKNITNSGFIGKPINTRTFAKEISQFIQ